MNDIIRYVNNILVILLKQLLRNTVVVKMLHFVYYFIQIIIQNVLFLFSTDQNKILHIKYVYI